MKHFLLSLSGTLAVCFALCFPARGQSAQDLLQQGVRLEQVQGDYEGAIVLYRGIASDATADRRVIAQALIQLGKAYESLGRKEAFSAYDRVAREFTDQSDLVAEARTRMRGLVPEVASPARPAGGIELVKLDSTLSTYSSWWATISADGHSFANTTDDMSRLGFQEIGKTATRFTPEGLGEADETIDGPSFSPDGRYLAYVVTDSTGMSALRVFDVRRSTMRVVREASESHLHVADWSADHRSVLLWARDDVQDRYSVVDLESGEVLRSADVENSESYGACWFEDRYVLYEHVSALGSDVSVLDLETGRTDPLFPHGPNNSLLGCSGRANAAVIRTDAFGDSQVWLYPLRSGRVSGEPVLLPEIGAGVIRVAVSDNGDLLYFGGYNLRQTVAIYPVSLAEKTTTGRGIALPRPLFTSRRGPGWTRQGDKFAYRIKVSQMLVRNADGASRIVALKGLFGKMKGVFGWSHEWSADGLRFIISRPARAGLTAMTYRVDAETGVVVDSTTGVFGSPGFSGDDILSTRRLNEETLCIDQIAGDSRVRSELLCFPDPIPGHDQGYVDVSPDGSRLAVFSFTQPWEMPYVVTLSGRTSQPLIESADVPWKYSVDVLGWLPDGSGLLLLADQTSVISGMLDDRPPTPLLGQINQMRRVFWASLHPDGSRMAVASFLGSDGVSDTDAPKELHILHGALDRLGRRE